MAFASGLTIRLPSRRQKPKTVCARYLSPDAFNVQFGQPSKSGNFGGVFFGEYADSNQPDSAVTDVAVKCPIDTDIGRQLYNMEKYTNKKLQRKLGSESRFPAYLGELIVPETANLTAGLVRVGLVWEREGDGETLEDFLNSSRIFELSSLLGSGGTALPLRRELTANIVYELALVLQDLQNSGIIHRDFKPANLLVVPDGPRETLFKAIDFGSSCDWSTPFKKGLGLATCDPIYTAPERRLDVFKPAFRFDVYSLGLIALRCALPSLTESDAMDSFVENILKKCDFSFERTCSAISSGRAAAPATLKNDINALVGPSYEDMYAFFATLLTQEPQDRAEVSDCLRSRFVRNVVATAA